MSTNGLSVSERSHRSLSRSDPLAQVKTRALEIAAELDRKSGPYYAEVGEGQGCWHIVRTTPGAENKATDHLAHRGIGVFQPRFIAGSRMRMVRTHEVVDLSEKLLFPGRVFVFVWDILAHWRRIMSCPGVHSIMTDGREKPVGLLKLLQYQTKGEGGNHD